MITNEKYKRLIKGYHKWKIQTAKKVYLNCEIKRVIKGDHKWKIQTANKRLSQMKNTNG